MLPGLAGRELPLSGTGVANDSAAHLLSSLGAGAKRSGGEPDPDPSIEWARSGGMNLTGPADGPPLLAPGPLASCARGTLQALESIAGELSTGEIDGAALLGEHAASFGYERRGSISPSGSCRLIRAEDRFLAVNLARPDDLGLLPAWLGEGNPGDAWAFVAERVASRPAAELVQRARLLGLPAAVAVDPLPHAPPWFQESVTGAPSPCTNSPLVIDLSSLWAGPLCTHLLGLCGARVVKVESTHRPDGARGAPPPFFDLLNSGKESVALDLRSATGRARLRSLVDAADIVVESSRPRALAQLGVDAESLVGSRPGLTWVSITGYGRAEPGAGWVAFGDDAGVAAGLAVATGRDGPPLFCGDAIADPLTGLHAALAALASWLSGGGRLLDLSLRDIAAHVLAFPGTTTPPQVRKTEGGWEVAVGEERAFVAPPRARAPRGSARPLGADTETVLAEVAPRC